MKKETIAVQFYLNRDDEIVSSHDYVVVDCLDDDNDVVEVLVEREKISEILVESCKDGGGLCTYFAEKLESFNDGHMVKYFVSVWCPVL